MRILVLVTGDYGQRHVENLQEHAPAEWTINSWVTPKFLPPVLDYPEDYLPESLPEVDLVLALAELPGVAEMIPDIAKMTGAQAVIAPIDNQAWLPFGLARQLREWLARMDVPCVTPIPFCSLTETHVNALRHREAYDDPLIREFARHFGRPAFDVKVDEQSGKITEVDVIQDACCGCARFAADKLVGTAVEDALEQVGLNHHHYPCQASMGIDPLFGDTLMHVSGNIMKDALKEGLGDNLRTRYMRPDGRADE
jgi:thymidylate synthase